MRVALFLVFALLGLTSTLAAPSLNPAPTVHHTTASYHADIAARINADPTSTWTAGVNERFANMNRASIRRQMGALKTPPSMRLPEVKVEMTAALPDTFDARTYWPQCPSIGLIRDQSDCGSCWAFGAVEAATDRICIETNATKTPMISANDLTACCSECGFGCGGGYLPSAWNYLVHTGVVTGGNYNDTTTKQWCEKYTLPNCDHHEGGKYVGCSTLKPFDTPKCVSSCDADTSYTTPYGKDKHQFATSYSVPANIQSIAAEIYANGPVEAAFTVYEDFLTYKSGVYSHKTGGVDGGHAVKIMGWGTENGTPYWLVANSWNEDWGDKGTFKILRGKNECGIEDSIVAGKYIK
jgi:cathepsin B